jgi:hypothetical protein
MPGVQKYRLEAQLTSRIQAGSPAYKSTGWMPGVQKYRLEAQLTRVRAGCLVCKNTGWKPSLQVEYRLEAQLTSRIQAGSPAYK